MSALSNMTWWLGTSGAWVMLAIAAPAITAPARADEARDEVVQQSDTVSDGSISESSGSTLVDSEQSDSNQVDSDLAESVSKSGELSVPPLDHVEYPSSRPDWVSNKPDFSSSSDTIVVVAGPCETKEECLEELRWMQRAAITTYIARLVEQAGGADFYTFSDEEVAGNLVARQYVGQVTAGGSPKYEHAVELRFDPKVKRDIIDAWKNQEVGDRLSALGAVTSLGAVLLLCSGGLIGIASRRVSKRENAAS
ncbi:hypothetical protein Pla22_15040 [Rubripirellula amarantea]|uniref:Transmembrane protein n=1 Tax=Rubripirellula amarantea TaxID=2527999 RepID=A0A5C5WTN4_9BACT|nr:hypothetical protein [Rubripirellula amarantea]TWT53870.1 hypothetical protein Pla22_15040 [Rubripirellula amarantea]